MSSLGARVAASLIEAIRTVCPNPEVLGALHEPIFEGNEERYVTECVRTGWVSSAGTFVDRFEADLARIVGADRAVAVVNGTAALEVSLAVAGVHPGDEVIIPTLTFVATANAVSHLGAVPYFLDSDPQTLGLDAGKLADFLQRSVDLEGGRVRNRQTGRCVAAVVPVHVFGHPADMNGILDACRDLDLPVVEDAAESLGSYYGGEHTGTFGRLGVLSFNGNKIVTTGGGGAILTDDQELAERVKHLTTTGKRPHPWRYDHDTTAWNYRMPNLNAALGCAQLERLTAFVEAKRALAIRYEAALRKDDFWTFVEEPEAATSNYWLNAVRLKRADKEILDKVLEQLQKAGIAARPAWTPMHRLPMYAELPRTELTSAEELSNSLLNLPSGVGVARNAST